MARLDGNARDIGDAALWLAADESEWITGIENRRRRRRSNASEI